MQLTLLFVYNKNKILQKSKQKHSKMTQKKHCKNKNLQRSLKNWITIVLAEHEPHSPLDLTACTAQNLSKPFQSYYPLDCKTLDTTSCIATNTNTFTAITEKNTCIRKLNLWSQTLFRGPIQILLRANSILFPKYSVSVGTSLRFFFIFLLFALITPWI